MSRKSLIRLASSLEAGSEERKIILRMAASHPKGHGWKQYMHGVWKKEDSRHDIFWIDSLDDISWLRRKVDLMAQTVGGALAPLEEALSSPKNWRPTAAGGFAAHVRK
jgi:hypothetical protein